LNYFAFNVVGKRMVGIAKSLLSKVPGIHLFQSPSAV
jgi:hypothetical protein